MSKLFCILGGSYPTFESANQPTFY